MSCIVKIKDNFYLLVKGADSEIMKRSKKDMNFEEYK